MCNVKRVFTINEKKQPIEKKTDKRYELKIYIWGKSNIYETNEKILILTDGETAMNTQWYVFGRKHNFWKQSDTV